MMRPTRSRCSGSSSVEKCARVSIGWIFAHSGEAALHMLDTLAGDEIILLLLDMDMPGMGGLDLLPRIKGRKPGLPVFVRSAYGDADMVSTARKRGADE